MYTVCTERLSRAVDAPWLAAFSHGFIWVALAAWTLAFLWMAAQLVGRRAAPAWLPDHVDGKRQGRGLLGGAILVGRG